MTVPTFTLETSLGSSNEILPETTSQKAQPLHALFSEYDMLVNSILDEVCVNSSEHITLNATEEAFAFSHLGGVILPLPEIFQDVLKGLRDTVDNTKTNYFNVYREDIFQCCIRGMRRKGFAPLNRISVKFSDMEGVSEGAVDEGGPKREMFRLVIHRIRDSNLFTGGKKKNLSLNAAALRKREYFEAGRVIALSLVHGGPAPHFFSDLLFDLVIAKDVLHAQFNVEDAEDEIKDPLISLQNARNLNEARDIIISNNIFLIAGYNFINEYEDRSSIVQGTLRFYLVNRIKEALDQFVEGLTTCNIHDNLIKYPDLFRPEMCSSPKPLSAESLEQLFMINYSEPGSNNRRKENKIITYFRDYLADCELNSEGDPLSITLKDVLIFATGADEIPPLGFSSVPQVVFLHGELSNYPTANTCTPELRLPTVHDDYDDFRNALDFGISNCKDFGFAYFFTWKICKVFPIFFKKKN